MPELPEVEITARRLDRVLAGAEIESALAPGINALKTFDPPLSALEGRKVMGVGRRGKHLVVKVDGSPDPLVLLIHLMSAGRFQLYDKRAGLRDRTSRLLLRLHSPPDTVAETTRETTSTQAAEWELRLREFGSKQAAWVKLLREEELEQDKAVATLGPEAWPDPPELGEVLNAPRPLHTLLRDQRTIAGIGRSWVDEILWEAKLSPYKRGADLDAAELSTLREVIVMTLGRAIDHYEDVVELPIPDKLPMPLRVHRHEGEPCLRCGTTLESVYFESYVIAYCPVCQTDGRKLKDRRLSKLLK